jgi:hypothetical protein
MILPKMILPKKRSPATPPKTKPSQAGKKDNHSAKNTVLPARRILAESLKAESFPQSRSPDTVID